MTNFRLRRRVTVEHVEVDPKLKTRQEPKASCDVNLIVAQARRGIPPTWLARSEPVYMDVSEVPKNLDEAYAAVQAAEDAFMALPAAVRTDMDNDPRRLEQWIKDPRNLEIAERYGLVEVNRSTPSEPEARSPEGERSTGKGSTPARSKKEASRASEED